MSSQPLSSVSVLTLYFQDVLTLHIHDSPSSVSRLELYFPNSRSIRWAPILTAKHSSTSTYWYYTVLNLPYIIPTHNRRIGLGQSYKHVSKCYFLYVKGPRGGKQALSHFLFPLLWVKLKTYKLITVLSALLYAETPPILNDQFG